MSGTPAWPTSQRSIGEAENRLQLPWLPLRRAGRRLLDRVLAMLPPTADRIGRRLRSPRTRPLYDLWLNALAHQIQPGDLPPFNAFDPTGLADADSLVIAAVDAAAPFGFRMMSVGASIRRRYAAMDGRAQGFPGDDGLGSLEAAYRRCVETRTPTYEYARFAVGDALPLLFERLLLPLTTDGTTVSHLVGMVVFTDGDAKRQGAC